MSKLMEVSRKNNKTVIMTRDLGRYLQKGDVVHLVCKWQGVRPFDKNEVVNIYRDGMYITACSIIWFLGGINTLGEKISAHSLDVTEYVDNIGYVSDHEREVIKMLHPGVLK